MKKADSKVLRLMIKSAANELLNNVDKVNDMNVFPVPDGDTGTNMSLTFGAAAKSVEALDDGKTVPEVMESLAKSSLRNARGNSGVILSQIIRGLWQGTGDTEEIEVSTLKRALCAARDTAYRAVMKPTEGTILTVIREIGEFAEEHFVEYDDVTEFMKGALAAGEESLKRTPDILPVLKQAGVVDAGGCGVIMLLRGAVSALETGCATALQNSVAAKGLSAAKTDAVDTADIKFKYCTEFLINKEPGRSAAQFMAAIKPKGDCMLVIDDEEIVKVHIHTNHPGFVIEQGIKLGELTNLKIDNMKFQHNEILAENKRPLKKYGFVAVVSGSGFKELFGSLECDRVVEGGQTMNPSTQDLLDAVEQVEAENVFILPNNSNIILAAEQVDPLTEKNVFVIPTENMPQGITAIASFSDEAEVQENIEMMTECMEAVRCGQIAYAARAAIIDGMEIAEGDIMGVIGSSVCVCGKDMEQVFTELAEKLVEDDCGVLSVYYGMDADESRAEELSGILESMYPDLDINLNYGGQSVYYYIISAE